MQRIKCAMMAAGVFVAVHSYGGIIAYDNAPVSENQDWNGSLGMDFTVNSPITVTALGAFDSGNIGNLSGVTGSGVTVQIYDVTTGLGVGPAVTFNPVNSGTQISGDAFLNIAGTVLPKGIYSIVTFEDDNYNQGFINNTFNPTSTLNTGGGAITFVGGSRYSGGPGFPTTLDSGPANRYDAGTFEFSTVPDGGMTAGMLGLAMAGLGFIRRKIGA